MIGLPQVFGWTLLPARGVSMSHMVRDGVLGSLVAVALVAMAIRPRWSSPLAILVAAAFAIQVAAGVTDAARNRVGAGFEGVHMAEAVAVVLALLAARRARPIVVRGIRGDVVSV